MRRFGLTDEVVDERGLDPRLARADIVAAADASYAKIEISAVVGP
ncbi:MAG TPA: hypothetical protein VIR27_18430 [Mycobacteriales bacterium]